MLTEFGQDFRWGRYTSVACGDLDTLSGGRRTGWPTVACAIRWLGSSSLDVRSLAHPTTWSSTHSPWPAIKRLRLTEIEGRADCCCLLSWFECWGKGFPSLGHDRKPEHLALLFASSSALGHLLPHAGGSKLEYDKDKKEGGQRWELSSAAVGGAATPPFHMGGSASEVICTKLVCRGRQRK